MTSTSSDSPKLGPVQSQERIILLDVLRAVAILGMFYMNWIGTYHPDVMGQPMEGVQGAASFFLGWFAAGKFWPLFALLMGAGMGVQIERAEARGEAIIPTYMRRLFSLYFIGWFGSFFLRLFQLYLLASAGFVALFIGYTLRRHRRLLLVVIIWVFLGNSAPSIMRAYEREIRDTSTTEEVQERSPQEEERYQRRVDRFEQKVAEATTVRSPFHPVESIGRRFGNLKRNPIPEELRSLGGLVEGDAALIHFMLFGFFLWQIGLFKRSWKRRRFFTFLLLFSSIVALAEVWSASLTNSRTPFINALGMVLYLLPVAWDLAYISLVALLLSTEWPARLLKKLAPAGRMAFTNFVLHLALPPVLFPILFGWWLPGVGKAENMAKVTVVFALMVIFSTWWLKRFRFGPFEWLWRSLTYWKLQPMRVEKPFPVE